MSAEIYTKPNCPYCVRAKALFAKRGIEYTETQVLAETPEQTEANRQALIERVVKDSGTTPRTMPQIYLEGAYIGGHDDLVAYFAAVDAAAVDAAAE